MNVDRYPAWVRSAVLLLLVAFVVAGCRRSDESLMPLRVGDERTYSVRTPFQRFVKPVRVVRQVPVAGVRGYELVGPLGVSRLAWLDGVLVAEMTAGARLTRPLPLLNPARTEMQWQGWIGSGGKRKAARATIRRTADTVEVQGRTVSAVRSDVAIKTESELLEIRSWFRKGSGLVRQEQRTNGRLDLSAEWVSGP